MFTFRQGGVSHPPYDSLNLGYHVNDDPELVEANRGICAGWLGGELADWVVPEQVHGTAVAAVGRQDAGRGSTKDSHPVPGVDALVTNQPGITLTVLSADCVPILFFDPVAKVIGAAHSGWKGTVGHIAREVLDVMQRSFGSSVADVDVWLGPSVRRCCYEVNDVVAAPVIQEFGAKPLIQRHHRPGKYLLSLQACIRADLVKSGVLPGHIHDVGVCSACRTDVLFSHRAEHGRTGRFMGAVRLVDET